MFWNKKKKIYLDHAATTPMDGRVLHAMNQVYKNEYFNPGGLYAGGVAASQKISACRKSVANLLGTTSDHVVFTRGGTESCNMGILGVLAEHKETPHVITSEIEHSAVLETLKHLEQENKIELSIISVDENGIVIVDEIKKALRPETVLVSIMYVNNEIGTVQPIREITKLVRWYKKHHDMKTYPLVHTDAIQATNYLDINVERLGVDLMSLSGSKIYGPKSSGVLYVRNRELINPIFHGGDQEFGLRAGTPDIAQIIGFTKALEIARNTSETENNRLSELQEYFFNELEKNISDFKINGSREHRVCNNINISISGISSERLVIELDAKGIAVSSKSACRNDKDEESYVIAALRRAEPSPTQGSIRFTMGRGTIKGDIDTTVRVLKEIVDKIRVFEEGL